MDYEKVKQAKYYNEMYKTDDDLDGVGYEWGIGHYCLVSEEKYPALHSSKVYDLLLEALISTLE